MSDSLKATPLTERHIEAGAKMADFAGWNMPLEYPTGVLAEHAAVRDASGLFDVSHMGELYLQGASAIDKADRLLTNSLAALDVGQVQYTLMCTESGGVVDDMLATRLSPDEVLLVPNAANTPRVLASLREVLAEDELIDASERTAMIAVQGPDALGLLADRGVPVDLSYMQARKVNMFGSSGIVSRTGYTGESGVELILPAEAAAEAWDALVQAGATPCGLGARDTLRTEMGYPLHGQDLSEEISPVEAGLGWAIDWDGTDFRGAAALREQRGSGPRRRLRGIELLDRGVLRPGMSVVAVSGDGEDSGAELVDDLGITTSGTFSPTLKKGVGLALLTADVQLGEEVRVAVRNRRLRARVTRPPFVDSSPR